MRLWVILIALFFVYGCTSMQVIELGSKNTPLVNNIFTWENDTLKIAYGFWQKSGLLYFEIYNKLDVPIYVDWKKSSYILNGNKFDYWVDKTTINTKSYYGSYLYSGTIPGTSIIGATLGSSASTSQAVKDERITFIPPKSSIRRGKFTLFAKPILLNDCDGYKKYVMDKVNHYKCDVTYEASYIKFRNFITYSSKEDISNEHYADSEFFISKVYGMHSDRFDSIYLSYPPPIEVRKSFYIGPY